MRFYRLLRYDLRQGLQRRNYLIATLLFSMRLFAVYRSVQFYCHVESISSRGSIGDYMLCLFRGMAIMQHGSKTMLLRLMCGLIYATEGSVSVNDRRLGKDLDFPESVGVMIESPAFIDEYTGQKNLELLAGLKQLISASDIHNTLQAVGLDPNDKRTFKKYSLGMKQRLGIAAALMEKPDLLILDEPTNALDEQGVAMIAQLIRKECQCGALVVVACHDADFVQSVSDVVIQIQAGRVTSVIGK